MSVVFLNHTPDPDFFAPIKEFLDQEWVEISLFKTWRRTGGFHWEEKVQAPPEFFYAFGLGCLFLHRCKKEWSFTSNLILQECPPLDLIPEEETAFQTVEKSESSSLLEFYLNTLNSPPDQHERMESYKNSWKTRENYWKAMLLEIPGILKELSSQDLSFLNSNVCLKMNSRSTMRLPLKARLKDPNAPVSKILPRSGPDFPTSPCPSSLAGHLTQVLAS